jgi:hypothetical protein
MLTRRTFLLGVGTTGLALSPAPARSAFEMEKITIGLIGLGRQGQGYLKKLLKMRKARLGGLCDADHKRMEQALKW